MINYKWKRSSAVSELEAVTQIFNSLQLHKRGSFAGDMLECFALSASSLLYSHFYLDHFGFSCEFRSCFFLVMKILFADEVPRGQWFSLRLQK